MKPKVKYPLAVVTPYGPDDRTVTKLTVGIVPSERSQEVSELERWVGTKVAEDPKVAREMCALMKRHG